MKKCYVLDTNVLITDPNALHAFEDNDVVIPFIVLEELDKNKTRQDEIGRNARQVSRQLDDMRSKSSLMKGVILPGGGKLKIVSLAPKSTNRTFQELRDLTCNDNLIILTALQVKKSTTLETILVSKDINVRLKCDAIGLSSEDYLRMRIAETKDSFYTGICNITVSKDVIDQFYRDGEINPQLVGFERSFFPNEYVVMRTIEGGSALTRFDEKKNILKQIAKIENAFGLRPRNLEQWLALDMLFDPDIKLITITGPAGCGKTLLAVAAGMQMTLEQKKYEKLIITRPVQPLGRDIGYLPGTIQEKMDPWIMPIKDNLNFLTETRKNGKKDESYVDLLIEKRKIEIEAITFIRGRSIPYSYIILDEAQNLSPHELKTIITRVGDDTKIILTGDLDQIDNSHLDVYTNGLTYAVEKFKEFDVAAHITLQKGERSQLATIASKIL